MEVLLILAAWDLLSAVVVIDAGADAGVVGMVDAVGGGAVDAEGTVRRLQISWLSLELSLPLWHLAQRMCSHLDISTKIINLFHTYPC